MLIAPDSATINVSLVSHTNVGKTSLMRTLVRRDIGEVADRPHVTEAAEGHVLIETPEGDALRLWDTPGLGDSARLLQRLRASANPIGWLLGQVWDRFADRPLFSSQQALRNVRDEADVVLYLVNASEDPASAAYVPIEMQILEWTGKPVVVLLNQTGAPRTAEAEAAEESAWSRHLAAFPGVRATAGLDAFARCWVQEDRLLGLVGEAVPGDKHAAFERLRRAWRRRNLEVFDEATGVLAASLAELALDRERVDREGGAREIAARTGQWLAGLAREGERGDPAAARAMAQLARRLERSSRESTERLIALHGLSGEARAGIPARLAGRFRLSEPVDVGASGLIGGVVSGAIGGLAADLAAAGLTFGAGAVIGGILGALGASGAARAYNVVRGVEKGEVRWTSAFFHERVAAALLTYLAVAHYGRGRGDWSESELPAHWPKLVEEVTSREGEAIDAAWRAIEAGGAAAAPETVRSTVSRLARECLVRLYPGSRPIFEPPAP